MTVVATDIYGYRQRYQYSDCVHVSMWVYSIQEFTEFLSETSSKADVSCWSKCFSTLLLRTTQVIPALHLHMSLPKQSSGTATSDITVLVFRHVASQDL